MDRVADKFTEFIQSNREALQSRYSLPQIFSLENLPGSYVAMEWVVASGFGFDPAAPPSPSIGVPRARGEDRELGWIHLKELNHPLARELEDSDLGRCISTIPWVAVDPILATVYTAALADEVATANDLAVVTDRQENYGILSGWSIEEIANALLCEAEHDQLALDADQVGALYAAVAVRTVVPAKLDEVPVDKIIKARRSMAVEFDTFRDHLNLIADRLAELGHIRDSSVLQARLEMMAERDLRRPTDELERRLRQLGLEPAQALLALKSLELPATAAVAASAVALPPVIGHAGLIAARLITSGAQFRARRRDLIHNSPAAYLLGLEKHLTPGGFINRLRRSIGRSGKISRRSE